MGNEQSGAPVPARVRGLWWKGLLGVLMSATIVRALTAEPVRNSDGIATFSMQGHGAKIIFFHVPCAWLAIVAMIMGVTYAVRTLRALSSRGARDYRGLDARCAASMELGLVFAVLATVTGSIFSHNEWGMYWSWDPRQTSILIVLLMFAAYGVLRGAVSDPESRARLTAAYAAVSTVPGLFLMVVLPRVVETMHGGANRAVVQGGLGGSYRVVLWLMAVPAFMMMFTWIFQLRVRASALMLRADVEE